VASNILKDAEEMCKKYKNCIPQKIDVSDSVKFLIKKKIYIKTANKQKKYTIMFVFYSRLFFSWKISSFRHHFFKKF
jgi:hypothetical protein